MQFVCYNIIWIPIDILFSYRKHDCLRAKLDSGENGQEKGEMVLLCVPEFIVEILKAGRSCVRWMGRVLGLSRFLVRGIPNFWLKLFN